MSDITTAVDEILEHLLIDYDFEVKDRDEATYSNAKQRILDLITNAKIEELEALLDAHLLDAQRETKHVKSQLFPNASTMEVYEVPINLIWNRISELKASVSKGSND